MTSEPTETLPICGQTEKCHFTREADPTSLDPLETNPHRHGLDSDNLRDAPVDPDVAFRHSGWLHDRHSVLRAFVTATVSASRLERFEQCGKNAWVLRDPESPERLRIAADLCHDRFCVPCAAARSRVIAGNLACRIKNEPHRFVTLTLRANSDDLAKRIRRLYLCFARLRRSTFWKQRVQGGAAFCELKWSTASMAWNVHLHLVAAGKWLDQKVLSALWLGITKDSFIVDVRLIHNHDATVRYVTKYASKPLNPTFLHDDALLVQAVKALKGIRLCLTFGSWRGVKLLEVTDDTAWVSIGSLDDLRCRAARGEAYALAVIQALAHKTAYHVTELPPEDTS